MKPQEGEPREGGGDLRERFLALRRTESREAPEFGGFVAQARRLRRVRPSLGLAGAAATAALLAAAAFILMPSRPQRPPSPVPSISGWRSPTDFLLDTPGRELLRSVPSVGRGLDGRFLRMEDPTWRRMEDP